jgi:uncharacterized protein
MMESVYTQQCELGIGLFASRAFQAGEEILRFSGREISLADTLAKGESEANALQVDDERYIDIGPPGVLANHSCDPNAGIVNDRVLTARRPIAPDEEICFDYSTTMWEGQWTMECRCGTPQCRGVVRDFPELPRPLREQYIQQRIVQSFIIRRLNLVDQV